MATSDELNQIFREEATELIEALLDDIAQLATSEDDVFKKTLDKVLRTTHNLKGAATSTGYGTVEVLVHALEGVLSRNKESRGPLSQPISECTIDALGIMQAAVDGVASESQIQDIIDRLASFGGEVIERTTPGSNGLDPVEGGVDGAEDNGTRAARPDSAIRVDTHRLDRLMGFIGEFLTFRARLAERHERQTEIYKQLQGLHKSQPEKHVELEPLVTGLRRLILHGRKDLLDFANLTDEVNETAKQLRMVPLRGTAHVWRRIVRESCRICDKEVQLEVSVGRVGVDRYVLEQIQDPMMHLLRNAVDHGIEHVSERIYAGKPPQGRIQVSASLQGAMVRLEVSDDGRGIDWEKVKRKAVEHQVITAERAERLTAGQTADLLFRSGFSTTDQVNQISGRGVGLDVVRSQLEMLGGNAEIAAEATLGGTTMVLWVPVSILSSTGLFVRCGSATYALPIESVVRTLRVRHDDMRTVDGRAAIKVGNTDPVRAIRLSEVMGEKGERSEDWISVVVLSRGRRHLGVVVDEVLGLREYVTHGLPWNFKHFAGINGAILEADGSVAVLIDVVHLFDTSHQRGASARVATKLSGQRVLVVDDSMSSRALQRAMLRADGYDVTLAADGQEAWRLIQNKTFDLVVSDIQMPNMNGIALTKKIRSASSLKDLPVILVTNMASAEDRAAGADAGADDYLVKGTFDQQELLGIVNKYLGKP